MDAPESSLGSADDVVYLGALDLADHAADGSSLDASSARRCEALACELPIEWLARLARRDDAGRAWLVTRGGQRVLGEASPGAPWQAPLWGVGRVFALEQPARWGGLIDLPPRGSVDELADILREAVDRRGRVEDAEDQVAWRGGSRLAARLVPVAAPDTAPVQLRSDATYLVTGGFGAVGSILARWLVERGARHVALLGRHASPDHEALRAVESMGARVLPFAGDVADEAGMRAVMAHFERPGTPPLRGVVHAAADVSSAPIGQLTREQIRAMLRPKIHGTVLLDRLTRDHPIDFIALFSSTTAVLGAWGLAHYAAANAFLDGFALAAQGVRRVVSINWGSWETMRASAERQREIHEGGLGQMAAAETLDALGRLLTGAEPQTMVARVDWSVLKPLYEARRPRRFLARVGLAPSAPVVRARAAAAAGPPASRLVERLAASPRSGRRELIVDAVLAEVSAVLGVGVDRAVPLDTGLFDLGMDSLMSVALRKRLERATDRSLPSTLTFNYPSVNALASFLESALVAAAPPAASEPAPDETPAGDGLTDAEVEARLRARLERYG
jgi:NAD(P)-dependent dehydrogenase (short-subunit alcohol dehydrogenase family)/acyl carrier protein